MSFRRAILIAGPTASGKSATALRLATRFGGLIINADSMQVYRELSILTARPDAEEEARAPHRLYGHVGAGDPYSVAQWLNDVERVLAEARLAGRVAIVVGGTGLYFSALTEGLSPIPPVDAKVRAHWRDEAKRQPPHELHAQLVALDPETGARVRPTDPQRIVRALEVVQSTGKPLLHWQETRTPPLLPPGSFRGLVIAPPRPLNVRRSDARFDAMMAMGALEEVARLRDLGLDPDTPAMRALGVRPLLDHLQGEMTLEAAVERAKRQTRHYIKRQATWLRRYMISWKWIDSTLNYE